MALIRSELRLDGGHLRLILDQPKANIVSTALMHDLDAALRDVGRNPAIKLVTIEGAGEHFSYGASVEEHRPAMIAHVLPLLHDLVRELLRRIPGTRDQPHFPPHGGHFLQEDCGEELARGIAAWAKA